jgi:cytochrome c nitrite reductase small subunit
MTKPTSLIAGALIVMLAVTAALGVYTFYYAKGYSYMVDNPKVCVNCHVMNDFYKSWSVSSHRKISCNSCHIPGDLVGGYATKVEHGMRHSYVFTFEDPQVIRLKESGHDIVQQNCIDCHAMLVDPILTACEKDDRCLLCHQGVAHGKNKP